MSANETQDDAFYDDRITKDAIQMLVVQLHLLSENGMWVWPDKVDKCYEIASKQLSKDVGAHYSISDIKNVVLKLNDRHVVFNKLCNCKGLYWKAIENVFFTNPAAWAAAEKDGVHVSWYACAGEPLWPNLAAIFDSWTGVVHGTNPESPKLPRTFCPDNRSDLDVALGTPDPDEGDAPSPSTIALFYGTVKTPSPVSNWPIDSSSPFHPVSWCFVTRPFDRSGGLMGTKEAFDNTIVVKREVMPSAKKKLFVHHESPGSSRGSNSVREIFNECPVKTEKFCGCYMTPDT